MEAEHTDSPLGNWGLVIAGDANYVAGATGTGHLQFNGNQPSGGNANSPLTYRFKITTAGTYKMFMRMRKNLEGAPSDHCNDCYVRMEGDFTEGSVSTGDPAAPLTMLQTNTKYYGGTPDGWDPAWACSLITPADVKYQALYVFKAGETYTLTMSGRSQRYNVDRIVLRRGNVGSDVWRAAPESARVP